MDRTTYRVALTMIFGLSFAPALFAQNTARDTAVDLAVGQVYHLASVDATTQRWFRIQVTGGRSYCVQAAAAPTEDVWPGALPQVTILSADGNSTLYSQTVLNEP